MPAIGQLNRRITLQSSSETKDVYGEEATTWSDVATVWAAEREETGAERIRSGRVEARQAVVFTIRYRAGVSPAMRIRTGGTAAAATGLHQIHGVREIGRRRYLELATTRDPEATAGATL